MKSILKFTALLLVFFSLLIILQSCGDEEEEEEMVNTDNIAPTLVTISPSNGAEEIPTNTNIILTFSEAIEIGSLDNSSLRLTEVGSNLPISGNISLSGNSITFDPSADLAFETSYSINVTTAVEDLAGNSLSSGSTTSFTTAAEPDLESPTIVSIVPENEAVDIAIDANIVLTFSEPIDLNSVSDQTVVLRTPAFSNNIEASVFIEDNIMTIDPTVDFEGLSEYTLTLGTGLLDLAGNGLEEEVISTFTTVLVDNEAPTIVSIVPENGETGVSLDANIIVTFSEPIDLNSVSDASLTLRTPAFSNDIEASVSIEGNVMTIDPTVDFEEQSEYTLTLNSELTDLAGNGLENTSASSFITLSLDTTGPNIVSFSIVNGETNFPVDGSIVITFDEPIDENSLLNNLDIRFGGTTDQFIGLTFEVSGNDVIVNPIDVLEANTEYVMNVTTNLTDLAGNRLRFARSRVFTTASSSLEVTTTNPSAAQQFVDIDTEVTVNFSSDINSSTATNFNFSLQRLDGNIGVPLNGEVQVNGSSVSFIPSEPLEEYETNYRLAVSTNLEDVSGNSLESAFIIEFTTVQLSDNYYYFIRNNVNPNSNTLRYDEATGNIILAPFSQTVLPQLWRFTREGDEYSLSSRLNGNDQVVTAISRFEFELIFTDRRASPSSAQTWDIIEEEEGNRRFILRNLIFGPSADSYLDGATLTIRQGRIENEDDTWLITRSSRIN